MKAINFKNQYYKVTEERGDFFYCEDNRGKTKVFLKADVVVEEIEALPKAKTYRKVSSKVSSYSYDREKTAIITMAQDTPYSLTQFSEHENATDIVKSIVSQARRKMNMSEKQAYVLAKFAEENNINL